jgi:hypothetical protein
VFDKQLALEGASRMKVLIDRCAPKALKMALAAGGFVCTTVQGNGWSEKENCQEIGFHFSRSNFARFGGLAPEF